MAHSSDNWLYERNRDNSARFILGESGKKALVCVGINPSTAEPNNLDPKNELRIKVKENLQQYLTELKEHLQKISLFKDLEMKVGNLQAGNLQTGNLQTGVPPHCWGALCSPPLDNMVHKPHFNFVINADEFVVGVQIEGKKPANEFKANMKRDAQEFLKILGQLKGFDLIIRKRINPSNRPRGLMGIPVAQIALGDNVSQHDIEFISKSLPLVVLRHQTSDRDLPTPAELDRSRRLTASPQPHGTESHKTTSQGLCLADQAQAFNEGNPQKMKLKPFSSCHSPPAE